MSDEKKLNPTVKLLFDLGPVVLFFVAYTILKDDVFVFRGVEYAGFIVVTALFVPLFALTTFVLYLLTGRVSAMQIMTLVLVAFFGGLSVWFNDERFFKLKPTLVYLLFTAILGFGLLRGQSYLKLVMGEVMPLLQEGWMILTKRLVLFFLVLAMANEFVWRTMSTDFWVNFETFAMPAAMFIFFMSQSGLMQKYAIEEAVEEKEES